MENETQTQTYELTDDDSWDLYNLARREARKFAQQARRERPGSDDHVTAVVSRDHFRALAEKLDGDDR